ncbi:hypothetical protein [Pseudonocardia asaccharolytica]|uniref:hypothetical protein n=1 Tax=Pseudonocardia asaccharolytica TaxID=54010 RepID=UPI0011BEB612|nr:hypothetical protein [Pseudonocardia asaccharolytica]
MNDSTRGTRPRTAVQRRADRARPRRRGPDDDQQQRPDERPAHRQQPQLLQQQGGAGEQEPERGADGERDRR